MLFAGLTAETLIEPLETPDSYRFFGAAIVAEEGLQTLACAQSCARLPSAQAFAYS